MENQAALQLADWFRVHTSPGLTHLKLQKLCFYGVGVALAFDLEAELGGEVAFEAWRHGPVCRTIWREFKDHGSQPLPPPAQSVRFGSVLERRLRQVVTIYDRLSAWQIREQSHLERPWKDAVATGASAISTDSIRAHFRAKFRSGSVSLPEYVTGAWSLALDGIPAHSFASIDEAAAALS